MRLPPIAAVLVALLLAGYDPPAAREATGTEAVEDRTEEQRGAAPENPPPDEAAPPAGPERLPPRARYNLGLEEFSGGDLEGAAAAFLAARDGAGPDAELRYRAAFNLGVALASRAGEREPEDPEGAIETLRQSAAWFQDAVRLGPEDDDDARVNLEIVLRRIQLLADRLNQGNRLELRLDRVIDDQRGLRDGVRRLLQAVEAEGVAAEPLGFQREFDDLATFERTLLAEVGSVTDLAAEERAGLEEKPEEERTDEERIRQVQLQSLDHYLQRARQSLSDARRRLRRLEGERAHRRADAALAELKRAREQLLDPVTVLKGIAQDQTELLMHTRGLDLLRGGEIRLDQDRSATAPAWLTDVHLEERQQDLALRTDEVHARLAAGVAGADEAAGDTGAAEPGAPVDPGRQRLIEAAREAIPHLEEAGAAMRAAIEAIPAGALRSAVDSEAGAIQSLLRAIERFAGVRDLIELAYGDQSRIVALLTPPEDPGAQESPLEELSTEERTGLIRDGVARNRERLARLEPLLDDDRKRAEAQVTEGADPALPAEETEPQLEAIRRKFDLAQQLRRQADDALETLAGRLDAVGAGGDLRGPAREALDHLEELRRLFFSIVEHLEELLRDQAETHDQTATLQFEGVEEADRQAELGMVDQRQARHADTGEALAEALARQADAAAAGDDPQSSQAMQTLAEAATEVRTAAGRMRDAAGIVAEAAEYAALESTDLEPALENQLAAMEHLENAIRLLQPPSGQQRQQQQAEQPRQQDEEQMSQRQASRRLQAIRDREAERQRRNRQALPPEPVEKDW